jgi:hypothetical protein
MNRGVDKQTSEQTSEGTNGDSVSAPKECKIQVKETTGHFRGKDATDSEEGGCFQTSDIWQRSENGEIWNPTPSFPECHLSLGNVPFHMVGSGQCNFSLRVNCLADSTDN